MNQFKLFFKMLIAGGERNLALGGSLLSLLGLKLVKQQIAHAQQNFQATPESEETKLDTGEAIFDQEMTEIHDIKKDWMVSVSDDSEIRLFSGSSNKDLAKEIATHLDVQLGRIETYTNKKNAELKIRILDSLGGRHAYVIQSLSPPINDNLMELCLLISALKRADAASVTAIIPYFAYSRHAGNDSKSVLKINAKQCLTNFLACADVASMLELAGCDRIITVNFHNPEIRGFFKIPLINIDVSRLCAEYLKHKKLTNLLVVSTDCKKMWVQRAFTILGHLQTIGVINRNQVRFGTLIPQKKSPPDNYIYVGPEVQDSDCLVIDSLIDTGSTLTSAAQLLYDQGAKRIFMYATHGLLTHDAWKQVQNSQVTELILTDTIPTQRMGNKIRYLGVGKILAEMICWLHTNHKLEDIRKYKNDIILAK